MSLTETIEEERVRIVDGKRVVVCVNKGAAEREIRIFGVEGLNAGFLKCYVCNGFNTDCKKYWLDKKIWKWIK